MDAGEDHGCMDAARRHLLSSVGLLHEAAEGIAISRTAYWGGVFEFVLNHGTWSSSPSAAALSCTAVPEAAALSCTTVPEAAKIAFDGHDYQ